MYNLIIYVGPALYVTLMIGGAVLVSVRHGGPAARERRWQRAMATWTGGIVAAIVVALSAAVAQHWLLAALWTLSAGVCAVGVVRNDRTHARARRIRMGPPTCLEEHSARYDRNKSVTWAGPDNQVATVHVPCPWCAAADFVVIDVHPGEYARDLIDGLGAHHTCVECRRGGRFLITHANPATGTYHYEVAQTLGDPPPAWLLPSPDHEWAR